MPDVSDDIFDIEETDPKKIVIAIDKVVRPTFNEVSDAADVEAALKYRSIIAHACNKFGVDFDVDRPSSETFEAGKIAFAATKTAVDRMKIDVLYDKIQKNAAVIIDETWRLKIHSYLNVVRGIVEGADVDQALKEKILNRLNDLAKQVDQYRIPTQKFSDTFAAICEGISRGSQKLIPAVRVLERIAGAVERLKGVKPEPLALPKPSDLGLPETPPEGDGDDIPF